MLPRVILPSFGNTFSEATIPLSVTIIMRQFRVWKLWVEGGKILYRKFTLKGFYVEEKAKLFGKGGMWSRNSFKKPLNENNYCPEGYGKSKFVLLSVPLKKKGVV